MPVLSLIGCKILEDEITHVLSKYTENTRIVLIEDRESRGLARKLRLQDISFSVTPIDRIDDFICSAGLGSFKKKFMSFIGKECTEDIVVVIKIMPLGLHINGTSLRSEVGIQVDIMSEFSDSILLFYGLCGNALKDIGISAGKSPVPLYVLKDGEGERVDDCISIALGGNRRYEQELKKWNDTATLYFTPLWASNWKDMKDLPLDSDMVSEYRYSFSIGRIVKLDTGLRFEKDFGAKISELAKRFSAETVEVKGNTEIVENCYIEIKKKLLA
ncbi:DUF1638 domain-containing protein [Methanolobus halotolerans]|uniref:DUF1638 domain-containing protein n=1 Tax=Methanolobus halotolerans TaxID=2052935 RepID=A0A4E0Q514_9EURY|nr:DUF1638 domain-containing protein [Methanolobus halotolerans]TGC09135.1 hypothetical protein CUN85_07125 [Methanolobus halotolerans]